MLTLFMGDKPQSHMLGRGCGTRPRPHSLGARRFAPVLVVRALHSVLPLYRLCRRLYETDYITSLVSDDIKCDSGL